MFVILNKDFNILCEEKIIKDRDIIRGGMLPFEFDKDLLKNIDDLNLRFNLFYQDCVKAIDKETIMTLLLKFSGKDFDEKNIGTQMSTFGLFSPIEKKEIMANDIIKIFDGKEAKYFI